jgi:hypothetical protein
MRVTPDNRLYHAERIAKLEYVLLITAVDGAAPVQFVNM